MNSTLLGLPREIKELIYFDALAHAANEIIALPIAPEVKSISKAAVAAFAKDVQYLTDFVDTLENSFVLKDNLEELLQTVQLMMLENHDEWYDSAMRAKKFQRVNETNGIVLISKYVSLGPDFPPCMRLTDYRRIQKAAVQSPSKTSAMSNFSSRFGMR
jgi:hypothetical protein